MQLIKYSNRLIAAGLACAMHVNLYAVPTINDNANLKNIIVFGDSLSDNGNLYKYTDKQIPNSPPYYEGRFSNGRVWTDYINDLYFVGNSKGLEDYAFGGAGISEDINNDDLLTLNKEIKAYLLLHLDKANANSLFIIWIGSNNYLSLPADKNHALEQAETGMKFGLDRLIKAGAKHILLINLPDLGKTPFAKTGTQQPVLEAYSLEHNQRLKNLYQQMQQEHPEIQWLYLDLPPSLNEIFTLPQNFGFTNVADSCLSISNQTLRNKGLLSAVAEVSNQQSPACEGYFFFDSVHPTTQVHQLIASKINELLVASGISFKE